MTKQRPYRSGALESVTLGTRRTTNRMMNAKCALLLIIVLCSCRAEGPHPLALGRSAPAVATFGAIRLRDDRPPLRPFTDVVADDSLPARERARRAHLEKEPVVRELFAGAGAAYPPSELLLRAYKQERELEVWAPAEPGAALVLVTRYAICAASGELGPKRREGDLQVPEGFYTIQYLWPDSAFHLAMRVGYPNVSDRILGHPRTPGGDIMIHGGCASIGCLAMSDERIQELYVMAAAAQKQSRIAVHIFPARDPSALDPASKHTLFWKNLYEGHALFEAHHRLPEVRVDHRGRYRFQPPKSP